MWYKTHNKSFKRALLFLLFFIVILVAAGSSFAANNNNTTGSTIYVSTNGNDSWNGQYATWQNGTNGPKQTIKNATATVNVNGQIYIANGQYKGTSNTGITIDHNMTITGESQSATIIDGTNTNYLFIINNGVKALFRNLILINGNSADKGGAIQNNGDLTINNCTIQKNTAADDGGGIYNAGNCIIIDSIIQNNKVTAYYYGYGGGFKNYNGNCILKNCIIQNNYASYGGGIDNEGGNCRIINCTIQNNNVKYMGGGISSDNNLIIINSTIQNNEAYLNYYLESYGGGILNNGNCNITGSTIRYNTADYGGGICNAYGTCTVTDSNVNNNIARKNGGGFYNDDATLNILNSIIRNNAANGPYYGSGGGIYNINSNLVINDSKITANTAVDHGGGIDNEGNTWIDITQCISGNNPEDVYGFGTLQIIHVRNERTNNCYLGLQEAINNAISDDTLILYNFIFNENIKINKNINLIGSGENNTFINGQGIDSCITIAKDIIVYISNLTITNGTSANGGGIYNSGNLTLSDVIISNNHAKNGANGSNGADQTVYSGNAGGVGVTGGFGGAIYNKGSLIITKTIFIYNMAGNGGTGGKGGKSVFAQGGTGGNGGSGGSGGAIYNIGNLTISYSSFMNNTAGKGGDGGVGGYSSWTVGGMGGCGGIGGSSGAIYNIGNLTISYSSFMNNTAAKGGKGGEGGDGNYKKGSNGGSGGSGGSGGANYCTGNFTIINSSFKYNKAGEGGDGGKGGYSEAAQGGNGGHGGSGGSGGANYCTGNFTIINSSFMNNIAGKGGDGGNGEEGSLAKSGIGGSGGDGGSGGSNNCIGNLIITDSIFSNNTVGHGGNGGYGGGRGAAGGYGGAINATDMNITSCNFTNNTAMFGGAISSNNGITKIVSCSFNNNKVFAEYNGETRPLYTLSYDLFKIIGAVVSFGKAAYNIYENFSIGAIGDLAVSVYNLTKVFQFQKNSSNDDVGPPQATGGAIDIEGSANLILMNSIFNGNNATNGGAIYTFGNGTINVINNTFTNNLAGFGGAIYSNSLNTLNTTRNLFKDNNGGCGGAIFYGGVIIQDWAKLTVMNNIFLNNTGYLGGVLYNGINGRSNSIINFNQIYGVNDYDIYNMYSSVNIDAKYNWWGSNEGPGTDEISDKDHMDFKPFMILTVTAYPAKICYGDSSTIIADLLHDSTNYDWTSSGKKLPDGNITIIFNSTTGEIIPISPQIINGIATAKYIANGIFNTTVGLDAYENINYGGKHGTGNITITKIPTKTSLEINNQTSFTTVTVIVREDRPPYNLMDEGNVTLFIGNLQPVILTLDKGQVSYTFTPPSSSYTLTARYDGTAIYDQSQASLLEGITFNGIASKLYVILTPSDYTPANGDTVLYTFKVGNRGPGTIHNVVFAQFIPEGFEFISASVDQGSWNYDASKRILTWNIGDVPVGDPQILVYLKVLNSNSYLPNPIFSLKNEKNNYTEKINAKEIASGKIKTIKMQKTGLPIVGLIIAILALLGGLASNRRK